MLNFDHPFEVIGHIFKLLVNAEVSARLNLPYIHSVQLTRQAIRLQCVVKFTLYCYWNNKMTYFSNFITRTYFRGFNKVYNIVILNHIMFRIYSVSYLNILSQKHTIFSNHFKQLPKNDYSVILRLTKISFKIRNNWMPKYLLLKMHFAFIDGTKGQTAQKSGIRKIMWKSKCFLCITIGNSQENDNFGENGAVELVTVRK